MFNFPQSKKNGVVTILFAFSLSFFGVSQASAEPGFDSRVDPNVIQMLSPFSTLPASTITENNNIVLNINKNATAAEKSDALEFEKYPLAVAGGSRKSLAVTKYMGGLRDAYIKANAAGEVPLVNALLAEGNYDTSSAANLDPTWLSSDQAKDYFKFTRPYCRLPVDKVPGGLSYGTCPTYGFPSGHSRIAWVEGIGLATMLPEVAPEIMARTAEISNGRVVLGVHSPLDVMGGRAIATEMIAYRLHDDVWKAKFDAARNQLRTALVKYCGSTIELCITGDKAPSISKATANEIERKQLTYGMSQIKAGGVSFTAPDYSYELLSYAYPNKTIAEKNAILVNTSIDSGYPLDSSGTSFGTKHIGWTRLDLGRALSTPEAVVPSGTGSYNALTTPHRLLDTRETSTPLLGEPIKVKITGQGGVASNNVDSVVLNVTAVGAPAPGFVTVYPSGIALPTTSNLNYTTSAPIANQVISKVGADGTIMVYVSNRTNVIVDVAGYFSANTSFKGVTPSRLFDSRTVTGGQVIPANTSASIQVLGKGDIPSSGVEAVVVNVTTANSQGPGHFAVFPSGGAIPTTSTLNYKVGETVAGLAISKVGSDGKLNVYTSANSHVIVDVVGYVPTGKNFTSLPPARVLDSRISSLTAPAAGVITLSLSDLAGAGVQATAKAVSLNLTVVGASNAGYFTVFPEGIIPTSSVLNYLPNEARANSAIAKIGSDGKIRIYHSSPSHVIVDVNGWWN